MKNKNIVFPLILFLSVVLAIGLTALAYVVDKSEQQRLDAYNVDYSDRIMQADEDFEEKVFDLSINKSKSVEVINSNAEDVNIENNSSSNTPIDNEDISSEEAEYGEGVDGYTSEIAADISDSTDIDTENLSEILGKDSYYLYSIFKGTSMDCGSINNMIWDSRNMKVPELSYKSLKDAGIKHGDIITIHYDEPDLQEKGSQDIEKAIVIYDYEQTIDKLNNTDPVIEETGNVSLLVTREQYDNRSYIIQRIMDRASNNEEYTITIEVTHHITDLKENIVDTKTKEY